jgi:hypothetical protein
MKDPFTIWKLAFDQQRLAVDAAITIWARSMQMWQGTMKPSEAMVMFWEKQIAAGQATEQIVRSINRRQSSPVDLARAAIKPYRKRTASNAKRLKRK